MATNIPFHQGKIHSRLCFSCSSMNLRRFQAEITIHHPGMENSATPAVFVFPQLEVCLECGVTQFCTPQEALSQLQT